MSERKPSGTRSTSHIPPLSFPPRNRPRAWLFTSAFSALHLRLVRALLAHGDCVAACLPPHEMCDPERSADFRALIAECRSGARGTEGWKERIRGIRCDGRGMASCAVAVAEAVDAFGRVDVLFCCKSESVMGTVEELSASLATQALIRDQLETVYFSHLFFIRAALPVLRAQQTGHIIALTSTSGHIATLGMPVFTAATCALEAFCDSLAYEVAPFNVRVTIVQPDTEVQILTNGITFVPPLPPGSRTTGSRSETGASPPSVRDVLSRVLDPGHSGSGSEDPAPGCDPARPSASVSRLVNRQFFLSLSAADDLVSETVHALAAIGGHENPPLRHVVGTEATNAMREKLHAMAEEMEGNLNVSLSVDIFGRRADSGEKRDGHEDESRSVGMEPGRG